MAVSNVEKDGSRADNEDHGNRETYRDGRPLEWKSSQR